MKKVKGVFWQAQLWERSWIFPLFNCT